MTGTENIRCAIRFQKEKHIYAELPRNTKRFLKDGLQIQVLEEKEGDCRIGKRDKTEHRKQRNSELFGGTYRDRDAGRAEHGSGSAAFR